jgi:hypothetical protein
MTTKRIMKLHEFNEAVYYRASCSCGESKCDLSIELEREKGSDMIFLNMYKNVYWSSYWKSDNFFKNIWIRIQASLKVLFTGYIKMEESFIFQGDEQIDAFLNALKEGRDYLDNTPE